MSDYYMFRPKRRWVPEWLWRVVRHVGLRMIWTGMSLSDLKTRVLVAWHALRGHSVVYRVTIPVHPGHPLLIVPRSGFVAEVRFDHEFECVFDVTDEPGQSA